jgi:hypothetical protein
MPATAKYLWDRPATGRNISACPIYYSPLSVALPAKIRFLNLTGTSFAHGQRIQGKWLKPVSLTLALAGLLVAGALFYAGRQAETATTYSAMTELAGARNAGNLDATLAAMSQAAEQDVFIREQRIQNLLQAAGLSGWQRLASPLTQYMSYGPLCRQEALTLERQQLAQAQDAVARYEAASTRQFTRSTRDLVQN